MTAATTTAIAAVNNPAHSLSGSFKNFQNYRFVIS